MSKALAGQRGIVKAKPKTHFMINCRDRPAARNPKQYRWLSACGQVGHYVKTRRRASAGRELITVNCGNCIRRLKGKPPEFPGKMVMLIESKPETEEAPHETKT
jgi:hypothetical protein